MTVLKRFEDALKPTKEAVIAQAQKLNKHGVEGAVREGGLTALSGYNFYNSSKFNFERLLSNILPSDICEFEKLNLER